MNIAITVVIIVSIFNFVFTYSVAKVVLEHAQVISVLAKGFLLLSELYLGSNATTDKEDKNERIWIYKTICHCI